MQRWFWCLLPLLLIGCASGPYKISKEEYRERVRTLGVLPLMVDEGSTINHPERVQVIDMLRRHNAGREERLIARLKDDKGYFDIRRVPGDPRQLFQYLVSGSSLRGQGPERYRRYQFDGRATAEIAATNVVDGLLVLIVNGVDRTEKRRDRGPLLSYLEALYNPILVTAAVVLPSGEIAWESAGQSGEAFLHLQYPAFDEAFYNKTDEVRIKFISVPGLERTLAETEGGLLGREKFPRAYRRLFDEIAAGLHPGLLNPLKGKSGTPSAESSAR